MTFPALLKPMITATATLLSVLPPQPPFKLRLLPIRRVFQLRWIIHPIPHRILLPGLLARRIPSVRQHRSILLTRKPVIIFPPGVMEDHSITRLQCHLPTQLTQPHLQRSILLTRK